MGLHPLKLTDDEVQALITRAFRETGYRLDRRDPVIVQYMVQKFLLKDFDEKQRETFSEFTERIIPALKAETVKMEEQKKRLWDWSRKASREIVDQSGEEYGHRIREVIQKTDNVMLENLNRHVERLRTEQNHILSKIEEKRQAFVDTAATVTRNMLYLFGGNAVFLGIVIFMVVYWLSKR